MKDKIEIVDSIDEVLLFKNPILTEYGCYLIGLLIVLLTLK